MLCLSPLAAEGHWLTTLEKTATSRRINLDEANPLLRAEPHVAVVWSLCFSDVLLPSLAEEHMSLLLFPTGCSDFPHAGWLLEKSFSGE